MSVVIADTETLLGLSLQDSFLERLRQEHSPVTIFLVNGVKLQGEIASFDRYSVLLKDTATSMIYKNAISTIVSVNGVAARPGRQAPRMRQFTLTAAPRQAAYPRGHD